jgi:hypothetical protein
MRMNGNELSAVSKGPGRWSCCLPYELVRHEIIEARMRTHLVVVSVESARKLVMSSVQNGGSVIALAGRRIDPDSASTPRFPFDQIDRVRAEIADRLSRLRVIALVCSAACGADLIALEAAQAMGLRTRIILPFSTSSFRRTSVVDRPHPEYWGAIFNRVTQAARDHGDLIVLDHAENDDAAYSAVNAAIVEEARRLGGIKPSARADASASLIAVVVWEGASRGPDDNTKQFAELAFNAGFQVETILTRRPDF